MLQTFLLDSAHSYRAFRSQVVDRVRDSPNSADSPKKIPELELQSLWFAGAFGREFTSTCGQPVRIARFGEWNRVGGPDFKGSAVDIGEKRFQGAVEIDPEPEDWERHGHSINPAFNDVILHVFGGGDRPTPRRFFTRTSDHRNVIQVRLDLDSAEQSLRHRPPARAVSGRCAPRLRDLESKELNALIESAARHRLEQKARRFARSAQIHGWDQAIYEGIAEALGYHPNQLPMRFLAQRQPLHQLRSQPQLRREATLFGASGFLSATGHDAARPATRTYLRSLWEQWWRLRDSESVLPGIRWSLTGIRPLNHPHRRLGALAALLDRWSEFRTLLPGLNANPLNDWPRRVTSFLGTLRHPHWSWHYTLSSAPSATALALFGKERIHDLHGNVLYPIAVHDRADQWKGYTSLAGAKINDKLDRAALRLLGNRPDRETLIRPYFRQQALLQLYEDFCLEDTTDCIGCPFPEQLRQWT